MPCNRMVNQTRSAYLRHCSAALHYAQQYTSGLGPQVKTKYMDNKIDSITTRSKCEEYIWPPLFYKALSASCTHG